jgi:hypothetical protein
LSLAASVLPNPGQAKAAAGSDSLVQGIASQERLPVRFSRQTRRECPILATASADQEPPPIRTQNFFMSLPGARRAYPDSSLIAGELSRMAAADINRRRDRAAQINFRMSPEERDELRRRAASYGWTVQQYLEHVALGREHPPGRIGGRPFADETQEDPLPLTG